MNAPQKVSPPMLLATIDRYLIEETEDHGKTCVHCGGEIEMVIGWFSVHEAAFGDRCAGSGVVLHLPLPHCPECEPRPNDRGCVHV